MCQGENKLGCLAPPPHLTQPPPSSVDSKMSDAKNTYIKEKKRRYAISLATLASKPTKRLSIVNDGAIATLAKVSSDFFSFFELSIDDVRAHDPDQDRSTEQSRICKR